MELLLLLAIIPSLIIAFIVYKSDKKEKEPISELLKAFLLGVISCGITLLISWLFKINMIEKDAKILEIIIYSFIAIALVEEFSKWICGYLFLRKNNNFNYMYDGIVYMSFVSLGFATVENIIYAISSDLETVLFRAVTTVPAHVFFSIAAGYYFALAIREKNKGNIKKRNKNLILSFIVPILLHGFYDFCLLTGNYIFFTIYLVFIVSLYIFSIDNARRMERIDHPLDDKDIYCRNCGRKVTNKVCKCGNKVEE